MQKSKDFRVVSELRPGNLVILVAIFVCAILYKWHKELPGFLISWSLSASAEVIHECCPHFEGGPSSKQSHGSKGMALQRAEWGKAWQESIQNLHKSTVYSLHIIYNLTMNLLMIVPYQFSSGALVARAQVEHCASSSGESGSL